MGVSWTRASQLLDPTFRERNLKSQDDYLDRMVLEEDYDALAEQFADEG